MRPKKLCFWTTRSHRANINIWNKIGAWSGSHLAYLGHYGDVGGDDACKTHQRHLHNRFKEEKVEEEKMKWNENVRTPLLAALCKPKGLKIGCIDGMVSYYVWVTNDLSMAYVEFFSGRVHELSDAQSKSPFHCTPLYKKCSEIHTMHTEKALLVYSTKKCSKKHTLHSEKDPFAALYITSLFWPQQAETTVEHQQKKTPCFIVNHNAQYRVQQLTALYLTSHHNNLQMHSDEAKGLFSVLDTKSLACQCNLVCWSK